MEFDKSKVYTPFNCSEVKVGSKGYFSDYKSKLIDYVTFQNSLCYHTLECITTEDDYPFKTANNMFHYFYLVEEPKEKTKRPCTREELLEMLKKQGLPMLKSYLTGNYYMVVKNSDTFCYVYDCGDYNYSELCNAYTLLDGTELWVEE